jgi:DNA polymerase III epsilon subunit-like protein
MTMTRKKPGEKFDIAVFDTETTGLGIRAEILEFALILLDGVTLEEKGHLYTLIRPSSPDVLETADAKKALSMNHLDKRKDELLRAPTKIEFMKMFWEMRKKYRKDWVPSGYNIGNFDVPKLRYLFWQIRNEKPRFTFDDFFHYHLFDMMPVYMSKNWFSNKSAYVRLKDACAAYGVENRQEHNALEDTRATAELLRRMLRENDDN